MKNVAFEKRPKNTWTILYEKWNALKKFLEIFYCNTEPFLLCSVIESGKMQMKIVETILFEKWLVGENH